MILLFIYCILFVKLIPAVWKALMEKVYDAIKLAVGKCDGIINIVINNIIIFVQLIGSEILPAANVNQSIIIHDYQSMQKA